MSRPMGALLMGCALALSLSACSTPQAKPDPVKPTAKKKDEQNPQLKRVLKKAPYANPRWQNPPPGMQDGKQKD